MPEQRSENNQANSIWAVEESWAGLHELWS